MGCAARSRLPTTRLRSRSHAKLAYDPRGCTPERSHELGDLEAACSLGSGTCTEFHGLQRGGPVDRFIFPHAETAGTVVDPLLKFRFRDVCELPLLVMTSDAQGIIRLTKYARGGG